MADYKKQINTEVTFTPSDTTLTSFVWKIDGVQESTTKIFKKTFTTLGVYTVTLEGSNICGSCTPYSHTVEIVETVSSELGMGVIVIALGLGALYVLLSKKNK